MSTLVSGAATQLRVIYALALRETRTRYGQYQAGYIWALVEPVLWMGMFWVMYEVVGREVPNGMATVPFLATGILTYGMFAKTASQGAAAVSANRGMLFYPHVQPIDLVVARTALEAMTYVVVFIVVMSVYAMAIGEVPTVDSVLRTGAGFALASLLGMTFGLLLCALMVVMPALDRIRGTMLRPFFWTSGLFFAANELPSQARDLLLYNPVLHCTEIVRDGWFPAYHAVHATATYPGMWILGLALVGLTLERRVRRKVELT